MKTAITSLIALAVLFADTVASARSVTGPQVATNWIEGRSADTFGLTFVGNDIAQVRLRGYGVTVLEVTVYDQAGNVLARGDDYNGECLLTWLPRRTERVTIEVVNASSSSQQYFISSN
jgi:hypothetical protein